MLTVSQLGARGLLISGNSQELAKARQTAKECLGSTLLKSSGNKLQYERRCYLFNRYTGQTYGEKSKKFFDNFSQCLFVALSAYDSFAAFCDDLRDACGVIRVGEYPSDRELESFMSKDMNLVLLDRRADSFSFNGSDMSESKDGIKKARNMSKSAINARYMWRGEKANYFAQLSTGESDLTLDTHLKHERVLKALAVRSFAADKSVHYSNKKADRVKRGQAKERLLQHRVIEQAKLKPRLRTAFSRKVKQVGLKPLYFQMCANGDSWTVVCEPVYALESVRFRSSYKQAVAVETACKGEVVETSWTFAEAREADLREKIEQVDSLVSEVKALESLERQLLSWHGKLSANEMDSNLLALSEVRSQLATALPLLESARKTLKARQDSNRDAALRRVECDKAATLKANNAKAAAKVYASKSDDEKAAKALERKAKRQAEREARQAAELEAMRQLVAQMDANFGLVTVSESEKTARDYEKLATSELVAN